MTDSKTPEAEILPPESDQAYAINEAQNDRVLLHVCYGLLVGGFFSAGITSLIAVILAYIKRHPEEAYTFSHLTWIIRSFWIAFIGTVVATLLFLTVLLIPLAALLGGIMMIWNVIRIAKGWLRLLDKRPIDEPYNYI